VNGATQQKKERPPVFLGQKKDGNQKRAYIGTGRRKTAVARVFLTDGTGQILINKRPLEDYFTEDKDRNAVVGPLEVVEMRNRLDVTVSVKGGGFTGQAGATSQGIARALKQMFGLTTTPPERPEGAEAPAEGEEGEAPEDHITNMAKRLRDSGYLTRDGRMKERKKYGRKGARKSFQFSKR
jgi:small subunit ribosomal protein S9